MHVALVSPGDYPIPPIQGGSVEIYMHQLSQKLAVKNQLTIFARGRNSSKTGKQIEYHRILPSPNQSFLLGVKKALLKQNYDIIQIDNRPVYVKQIKQVVRKTPMILNLHSLTFLTPGRLPNAIALPSLQSADAIVVNSHYVKNNIVSRWPSLSNRLHVIYPGVDISRFISRHSASGQNIRRQLRHQYGINSKDVVLLYAGRILPQKGIHIIMEAFRRLYKTNKNVKLWIVGGAQRKQLTPYEQRIRQQAKGFPVHFFGFVTPQALSKFYLGADIFLCPSQSSEAFGMVNLEAAATGLPAIGSKAWGIQESIKPGVSGIHVANYKSPYHWQLAIEQVLKDPNLREKLSKGARTYSLQHDWSQVSKRFEKIYQMLKTTNSS